MTNSLELENLKSGADRIKQTEMISIIKVRSKKTPGTYSPNTYKISIRVLIVDRDWLRKWLSIEVAKLIPQGNHTNISLLKNQMHLENRGTQTTLSALLSGSARPTVNQDSQLRLQEGILP